jgi:hypothetical protein
MSRDKTPFFHKATSWVFIFFLVAFMIATKRSVSSWNDAARMATIQALVEQKTFSIENTSFAGLTADTYSYEGHTYSDKPPALALLGAIPYAIIHSLGITFEVQPSLSYYLVTLLTIGSISALGMVYLWKLLVEIFQTGKIWAVIVTLVTGIGTLFFPFVTVYSSHSIAGSLIIIAVYFCLTAIAEERKLGLVLAGVLFSIGASIDVTGSIFILFTALMIARHSLKNAVLFSILILPFLGINLFANWHFSGSILPPSLNAPLHENIDSPFSRENMSGLATHDSVTDLMVYAFHSLLGNRGLLSHSPILLVSLIGCYQLIKFRSIHSVYKDYLILLVGCLTYILIYLLRTNNYSGDSFGVRWFAAITPIFMLSLAPIEDAIRSRRIYRLGFWMIGTLSILLSVLGSYRPFLPTSAPVMGHPEMVDNTILVAFNRFLTQSSGMGMLRTAFLAAFLCLIFAAAMWFFHPQSEPTRSA